MIANCIVQPRDGQVPIRILNTREEAVVVNNFSPMTTKLNEYEIHNFRDHKMTSERARKVINLIELNHLRGEKYDAIYRICLKYFDVFQQPDEPLGVTNIYRETITLQKDARPVYKKPSYILPYAQKKVIDDEVKKLLDSNIIEPAKSPWSSPLLVWSLRKKIPTGRKSGALS